MDIQSELEDLRLLFSLLDLCGIDYFYSTQIKCNL